MRLWLDDERPAPEGWTLVRTAEEAIELLKQGKVKRISLDHDLGIGFSTGYKVACFIEQAAHDGTLVPLERMFVHSANPVGKARMGAALYNANKIWKKQEC